jgi:4'-phosphopantetheinyl transferase
MATTFSIRSPVGSGPATALPLPRPGVVDVWWSRLDRPEHDLRSLALTLSDDERERAAAMPDDCRRRFICCRGLLREILGACTDSAPGDLAIVTDLSGKPALPGSDLAFNLAHTDGMVVIAVTVGDAVGIDVERRSRPVGAQLCCRVFSPAEQRVLATLTPSERAEAAVRGWVRKEAVLKAAGTGLTRAALSLDVLSDPGRPVPFPDDSSRWHVVDLTLPDSVWVVAVAVRDRGAVPRVVCREWGAAVPEGVREGISA